MDVKKSIEQFLPKYLSPEKQSELVKLIDAFPSNLNSKFYTTQLKREKTIFQGDGILDLPISNFPETKIKNSKCIILSNTCDIDSDNKRFIDSRITYCPIVDLIKYSGLLKRKGINPQKIKDHIKAIRNQEITMILYLPKTASQSESIVLLDRTNNCSNKVITKENIIEKRIFTLSNYGFYLFLLKISISFTRIREEIDRN